MKNEQLVIVFVKNSKSGRVKTRLAKTIGNEEAIAVYNRLIDLTELATNQLTMDTCISFSDSIVETRWPTYKKTLQKGKDLGERMKHAFKSGFAEGYKKIVLIGSDLPEISNELIESAFIQLEKSQAVFGPAQDGGYYLVGLSKMNPIIFENKPWSQSQLLEITLAELSQKGITAGLLTTLNDVDTFEDLKKSTLYEEYRKRNTALPT
jgi:rSAM/selenodomain-associated transferase 1